MRHYWQEYAKLEREKHRINLRSPCPGCEGHLDPPGTPAFSKQPTDLSSDYCPRNQIAFRKGVGDFCDGVRQVSASPTVSAGPNTDLASTASASRPHAPRYLPDRSPRRDLALDHVPKVRSRQNPDEVPSRSPPAWAPDLARPERRASDTHLHRSTEPSTPPRRSTDHTRVGPCRRLVKNTKVVRRKEAVISLRSQKESRPWSIVRRRNGGS